MADNLLLPVSIGRILDSNGDPVSGAKVYVYDAGTTDEKNVYTDDDLTVAAANPIIADAGGYLAARYIGTGAYKLVIATSADVTIKTEDDLPGALAVSTFSSDEAIPITPVITKSSNYTVTTAEKGKVISCDASGGAFSITLLAAATAGDNFRVTIKNVGSSGTVTVDTTGAETIDGASSFALSSRYEAITVVSDAAGWHISSDARIVSETPVPRGYLAGLGLSNNIPVDTSHDIDIAAGICRDSTDAVNLEITSTVVKRIDATWASGTGNGGLASGASLGTGETYHVFLVDDSNGDTDAGFDDNVSATNLLSDTGGTYFRRIGSVRTDGSSNIIAFVQRGDLFIWTAAPTLSISATNPGTSAVLAGMLVPAGIQVLCKFSYRISNGGAAAMPIYFSSPSQTDEAPSLTAAPLVNAGTEYDNGAILSGIEEVLTDTSSQIRYRATNSPAAGVLRAQTIGWTDRRGQDD